MLSISIVNNEMKKIKALILNILVTNPLKKLCLMDLYSCVALDSSKLLLVEVLSIKRPKYIR